VRGRRSCASALVAVFLFVIAACSSGGGTEPGTATTSAAVAAAPVEAPAFVEDVLAAATAVEAELSGPQQYFEITSNAQFTNVFVAVDDATAAVAYAYIDGELQPPAPKQEGASGNTFVLADIAFDPKLVAGGVAVELPESEVDALSVYGDGVAATYVLAVTSPSGGFLDIIVGPDGQVFSVDPV
jgi:hypothetical protein